jgi:hypothetical protein
MVVNAAVGFVFPDEAALSTLVFVRRRVIGIWFAHQHVQQVLQWIATK